jgi:hypothetical protein
MVETYSGYDVKLLSRDRYKNNCFFMVFHVVLCSAADSVASKFVSTLSSTSWMTVYPVASTSQHSREAELRTAMPRAGFEATTTVTIINDMLGIVHRLGGYCTTLF